MPSKEILTPLHEPNLNLNWIYYLSYVHARNSISKYGKKKIGFLTEMLSCFPMTAGTCYSISNLGDAAAAVMPVDLLWATKKENSDSNAKWSLPTFYWSRKN